MGMKITDLPAASDIANEDALDMWDDNAGYDVHITMNQLKTFMDTTSCGRIRGTWYDPNEESPAHSDNDLDKATGADIGVWKWVGTAQDAPTGFPYTYALVEIVRHEVRAGTDNNYDLVQRLNVGDAIYQRMRTSTMETWSALKRFDVNYQVQYADVHNMPTTGSDGILAVTFDTVFNVNPIVVVTPVDPSPDIAFFAQVYNVTPQGFFVKITGQQLPTSGVPVVSFNSGDASITNATELSQYISDYCIPVPKPIQFNWIAIAPKTVTPSS